MSEDDYRKVKYYFKPDSLFDICKDLLSTYDVSLIDRLPQGLIDAFNSDGVHTNARTCSNGRKVLQKLIYNYYNKTPRPIARFISGPKNLTVHWHSFYNKLIYVFGEAHVEKTNCLEKFQEKKLLSDDIIPIEEYLKHLYTDPYVFIDLFAEFPAIKRGHSEYDPDIINFKPFIPKNHTLYNLFETFKYCVNPKTRHSEVCQVGRMHFFDVRTYNPSVSEYTTTMSRLFVDFNRGSGGTDQYINDTLVGWKKTLVYIQSFFIPTINLDKANEFFNVYILNNQYNVHELNTLVNTEQGDNLRPILQEFIREEIRKSIISASEVVKENIIALAKYDRNIFLTTKSLPIGVRQSFEIFQKFLTTVVAITADVYMLSRIFKKFNLAKAGFQGAIEGDQPDEAHNIIIYGGDQHSQRCRRFLISLGFEEVGKTGQAEKDRDNDSCIDMKHIRQPFFTVDSPEPNPHEHDYQFNYNHTYDFRQESWDPMIIV